MPELPEVETTVKGLNAKVCNRTFVSVWSDWSKLVKKPKDFKDFEREIKNKKIKKIWRRAKNIIFDLSGGYSLLIHQKMTGHMLVGKWVMQDGQWKPEKDGPLNDPYNRFLHLVFYFDNKEMMALSDARKFAKVELWKTNELLNSKEFINLGPEPLEESFTFEEFKKVLLGSPPSDPKGAPLRRGKVKQVLMVPQIIAGIGNIYASEILWQAKVHPEKSVAKLNTKELKLIYQAIKNVLGKAVKLEGDSFSDYRKPDGNKGNFHAERKVYNREGQECKKCKVKIKRIKFGGRSTFFCPNCQK